MHDESTRTCTRCGLAKSLDQFYLRKNGRNAARCRPCDAEVVRQRRQVNPTQYTHLTPVDRFWSCVDINLDLCWAWTGNRDHLGYGRMYMMSASRNWIAAHRYAWRVASGTPAPDDLHILHTCDTPSCVRNDDEGTYEVDGILYPRWGHLWLGTDAANTADKVAKGRHVYGTASASAKLTDHVVRVMRRRYALGEKIARLATEYGVTPNVAYLAITKKTWKHVDP